MWKCQETAGPLEILSCTSGLFKNIINAMSCLSFLSLSDTAECIMIKLVSPLQVTSENSASHNDSNKSSSLRNLFCLCQLFLLPSLLIFPQKLEAVVSFNSVYFIQNPFFISFSPHPPTWEEPRKSQEQKATEATGA